jgi:hypothetical protein
VNSIICPRSVDGTSYDYSLLPDLGNFDSFEIGTTRHFVMNERTVGNGGFYKSGIIGFFLIVVGIGFIPVAIDIIKDANGYSK